MCCGKRVRTSDEPKLPSRGINAPIFGRASVIPAPPTPRSIKPPTVPVKPSTVFSIKEIDEVCPKCACKLAVQLRFSDRLRRYYETKWCPKCKEGR